MSSPPQAEWQSGYAAACKAVYVGSIPASASKCQPVVVGSPLMNSVLWLTMRCDPRCPSCPFTKPPRIVVRLSDRPSWAAGRTILRKTAEQLAGGLQASPFACANVRVVRLPQRRRQSDHYPHRFAATRPGVDVDAGRYPGLPLSRANGAIRMQ